MRIELIDAACAQHFTQACVERCRIRRIPPRPGGHTLPGDDITHEGAIGAELKEDRIERHSTDYSMHLLPPVRSNATLTLRMYASNTDRVS